MEPEIAFEVFRTIFLDHSLEATTQAIQPSPIDFTQYTAERILNNQQAPEPQRPPLSEKPQLPPHRDDTMIHIAAPLDILFETVKKERTLNRG